MAMNPGSLKRSGPIRASRLAGSPHYVPLGPLGPSPLNSVPLSGARKLGPSSFTYGFPLRDVKEDFVRSHLEPMAELFVVVHPMGLKDLLDRLEREIIRNVLARERGNVSKAAEILGIKYTTLYFKVKKYRIEPVYFEMPGH
jgi:DNA-binding protein Fis